MARQYSTPTPIRFAWMIALVAVLLSCGLSGCGGGDRPPSAAAPATGTKNGVLAEAAPPAAIRQLQPALASYQPQVAIASPADGATLESDRLEVKLQVSDLSIYKDRDLGLGPHLRLYLDNQPPRDLYDLDQPAVFEHLEPGSHTLRAFAVTPWQESFKNAGAYAQTTFNILTATPGTTPIRELPLLTYNSPQGTYGAEPLLLDFYLNNAPLHLAAQEDPNDDIPDWRVRVTVNGESFTLRDWQPVYLTGFQPGTNWVKLELIDDEGLPIANAFNATARLVNYDPSLDDALARLTRGDLSAEAARGIVDPNYQPPAPRAESEIPEPEATEPEVVEPEPAAVAPEPSELEVSEPEVTESEIPESEIPEPEATEPEVVEPEPAAIAPEPSELDVSEPEVTEPDIPEPAAVEPEPSEPAAPETAPASPAELPAEPTGPVEESAPPEPASPPEPAVEAVEAAPEAEAAEPDSAPAIPADPDRGAEVAVGDRFRSAFQQLRNRFQ